MKGQIDIFGNVAKNPSEKKKAVKEKVEVTKLSFSKAQLLDQCNLRYYYQYYGSNKKQSSVDEPQKERLWGLKKLSNKHALFGNIIHDTIEIFYKKAKKEEFWQLENMIWLGNKKLDDAIRYSKNYEIGQTDDMEYPPVPLKEIVLGGEDGTEIMKEGKALIETCLTNFCNSPMFSDFFLSEYISDNAMVEKRIIFEIAPGVKIDGKMDLAYLDEEGDFFHIIDWKTGERDFEDTSLQLLIYAIWANEKERIPIENIKIHKAYLQTGKLEELRLNDYEIQRARAKIMQDFVEKMRLLHPKGMIANSKAFEPRDEENICALCPFEDVCRHKNCNNNE